MPCPNCGHPEYQQGSRCTACQWEPANDPGLVAREREKRKQEASQTFRENLLAGFFCCLFFIFIFWVFPSGRRAHDWFELTLWEVLWALILAAIGFSAMFKK